MWVRSLGQEDSPGVGNGKLLQHSWLENPMDRRAWWATVHSVEKSRTQLKWQSTCTHNLKYLENPTENYLIQNTQTGKGDQYFEAGRWGAVIRNCL